MDASREGTAFFEPGHGEPCSEADDIRGTYSEVHDSDNASAGGVLRGDVNFTSISIFAASMYSTILSGLFLGVAILQPRYGFVISSNGPLSPSAAALLTAFMAKTIELTFVMTVLAFLGQVLTRQALSRQGINLARVAMRSWILQPGTLITQWYSVKTAGFSIMGLLCLATAFLSLLYTTATGALVQPQLRLPPPEHKVLAGYVRNSFANPVAAQKECSTPIRTDHDFAGSTCTQLKLSSTCGSNFNRYITLWDTLGRLGNMSVQSRPTIFATLDNNVSISTSWLGSYHSNAESEKFSRIVNNITIAIPHRGVPATARHADNGIIQPQDLQDAGSYTVTARVAAPILNALCVNANRTELAPIIYETWPYAINVTKSTPEDIMRLWPRRAFGTDTNTNNHTVLDDVFGWRDEADTRLEEDRKRPIFFKFPLPGNVIVNHTSYRWGRSMVYILGTRPASQSAPVAKDYFLCSLKAGITTQCSTRYRASSSGQSLEALCNAENRYDGPRESSADVEILPDWRDIGFDFLNSMSLNTGMIDGDASMSRLLTQLQLHTSDLDPQLPSPAEALLAMASCTVLDLTRDFAFFPFWNYTRPVLEEPEIQYFNATIRVTQYMSGSDVPYQKGFIAVLGLTFAINLSILIYFAIIIKIRVVADICEPLILFILGYHSVPDIPFESSLRNGLQKRDFVQLWNIRHQDGKMLIAGKDDKTSLELKDRRTLSKQMHRLGQMRLKSTVAKTDQSSQVALVTHKETQF